MARVIHQNNTLEFLRKLVRARVQLVVNGMLSETENRNVKRRIKKWLDSRATTKAAP